VLPSTGSRKYLPQAITMPETASATKAMALAQWAARSKGVKRSIRRPVSGWWPPSGPLRQWNSASASAMIASSAAP